jgi:hypothetical protein
VKYPSLYDNCPGTLKQLHRFNFDGSARTTEEVGDFLVICNNDKQLFLKTSIRNRLANFQSSDIEVNSIYLYSTTKN